MIIYFIIVSSTCLSAKKQPLQAAFFAQEKRDENPGGFVTAQRSAKQRIPVFPLSQK